MARLAWYYAKTDGISAFLAGVASSLADERFYGILPECCSIDVDVFDAEKENLSEKVRERLIAYSEIEGGKSNEYIQKLNFEIEETGGSPEEHVEHLLLINGKMNVRKRDPEKVRRQIKEFFTDISFQLEDPKAVYYVKDMSDDTRKALSKFYTYMVFDVLFVEYYGYYLLLVFGTNE